MPPRSDATAAFLFLAAIAASQLNPFQSAVKDPDHTYRNDPYSDNAFLERLLREGNAGHISGRSGSSIRVEQARVAIRRSLRWLGYIRKHPESIVTLFVRIPVRMISP